MYSKMNECEVKSAIGILYNSESNCQKIEDISKDLVQVKFQGVY